MEPTVEVSVVIPAYNEEEIVASTLRELASALASMKGRSWEAIAVDDGSSDGTLGALNRLRSEMPELRVFAIRPNSGQSAAFGVGFRHARGSIVVAMDADGQNDPADIPTLVNALAECDCCCGYRAERRDTFGKRIGSKFANWMRNAVLGEDIIDTGCSLKAFRAEFVRDLTMWKGAHRFIPSLLMMKGARIRQIPVRHRHRAGGRSKYSNWGRLRKTTWDLMGVKWLKSRYPRFNVEAQL